MRKYLLEIAIFICGAVVMIFEITGSRILAPYFGTTIYVWSTLIGIILASLSIGYWMGGRISDTNPSVKRLGAIVLASGFLIVATAFGKDSVLNFFYYTSLAPEISCIISTSILFGPAGILLGTVSPYAVKLRTTDISVTGRTTGNLYAISTIGSIVGTFASGFLLIPAFGSTKILFVLSILLVLAAILIYLGVNSPKQKNIFGAGSAILLAVALYSFQTKPHNQYIDVDSQYNRLFVYDSYDANSGQTIRTLQINNHPNSAMYLGSDSLVYPYTQFYCDFALNLTHAPKRILFLGGGAYTIPMHLHNRISEATIDVVELDGKITALAKSHFGLIEDEKLICHTTDGRSYLNRCEQKYDLVIWDVFNSPTSIPFELTTLEAAEKVYNVMNDGGILLMNIVTSIEGQNSEFLRAEITTYKQVMKHVQTICVASPDDGESIQNIILAASKNDDPIEMLQENSVTENLKAHLLKRVLPEGILLRDDYAPVEAMVEE